MKIWDLVARHEEIHARIFTKNENYCNLVSVDNRTEYPILMKALLALFVVLTVPPAYGQPQLQQLVQLIDYVAVDYPGAVAEGQVVNEAEYAEMRDFATAIGEQISKLPASDTKPALQGAAQQLIDLIDQRESAPAVAEVANRMRSDIIRSYDLVAVPRKAPDLVHGKVLYAQQCAACHGAEGRGDGPQATGMSPPPIDFTDPTRYRQRTLHGLYSTITLGVKDTAMAGYSQLSDQERWDLAFYAGHLATTAAERERGEALWEDRHADPPLARPGVLTTLTPAEAEARYGTNAAAVMAYLRSNPQAAFGRTSPLDYARDKLDEALTAYRTGDPRGAYRLAVQAYLEGFELVEQGLDAIDPQLRRDVEEQMTALRNDMRAGADLPEIEGRIASVQTLLDDARQRLDTTSLSAPTVFASALVILLREGLEALLVVAALAAFLIKTERKEGLRYLHLGWIGALGAGFLTWVVSRYFFEIGGADREITEGVAAMLAAAVLFSVGFWLHDKAHATQWKRFIDHKVRKALSSGTLWALAGLSFIAVYREVFETILFYQALLVQTDEAGQRMAFGGMLTAVGALAVLAWLILRYSTRLPLRQFFGVTGLFMFVLAVIFAGKGTAALQEAGFIPVSPVAFPRIDLLGIYPNMQGLVLQAGLVFLALLLVIGNNLRRTRSLA